MRFCSIFGYDEDYNLKLLALQTISKFGSKMQLIIYGDYITTFYVIFKQKTCYYTRRFHVVIAFLSAIEYCSIQYTVQVQVLYFMNLFDFIIGLLRTFFKYYIPCRIRILILFRRKCLNIFINKNGVPIYFIICLKS